MSLRASRTLAAIALAALVAIAAVPAARAQASDPVIRTWYLSTGSNIAYVRFPAPDPATSTTLVILHGGPGGHHVADFERARVWYERLQRLNYEVVLYDQIGSGLSDRLSDPRQYTVERHVADLEAIRRQLGGGRIALLGESWGATLAVAYMAAHPRQVTRAVFVSPGAMDPSEWVRPRPAAPRVTQQILDWAKAERSHQDQARLVKLDVLLQQSVTSAYRFAGDMEMDALQDAFMPSVLSKAVASPGRGRVKTSGGSGWWAHTMTLHDALTRRAAPRLALAGDRTPVLVMRGDQDYLPAMFADQYAATFSGARYVKVPDAGHLVRLDQPLLYAAEIERFLAEQASAMR